MTNKTTKTIPKVVNIKHKRLHDLKKKLIHHLILTLIMYEQSIVNNEYEDENHKILLSMLKVCNEFCEIVILYQSQQGSA
jgi:hypothetical protein